MPGIADALPQANAYQAQGVQLGEKTSAGIDSALAGMQEKLSRADTEEKALDPGALKPPTLAPPPKPEETPPEKEWGSAAMAIAVLGGLFTRQPLINSLNAAGAVMNAYKAKDAEAAKTAYDSWKVSNDNAIKSAQFTVDAYKTALEQIKSDRDAAKAEVLATAAALKDPTIPYMMESHGLDAVVKLIADQQHSIDTMNKATPDIDRKHQQAQLSLALMTAHQDLNKAIASKDPAAIQAAKDELTQAVQDAKDFNEVYAPSRSGTSPDQTADKAKTTRLKDTFDKATSTFNTLSANPAADPKAVAAAKKVVDKAQAAYEAATQGGGAEPQDARASTDLIHGKADPSWPPAAGHPEGSKLKDVAGDVVATIKNGQWVPVKGIP